ncbi:MAG: alkaline phosphatase [Bryobacterales bacterium]|nr:alkaline phosphatase [Bryobacterales bacterium]
MNLTRRLFLLRGAALASTVYAAPGFTAYPFSLGVMSGDPTFDGFVLWTRLAPDPLNGGGMGTSSVEVEWMVAEDESMRRIVKKGKAIAAANLAHSVHVEVAGLRSSRPYWYQFKVGKDISPIGRAITAPKPGESPDRLKFAFASCQHWEAGLWTAYDDMAAATPDLVVHLGDYIYEGGINAKAVRQHNSLEIKSLSDYRNRHALYKTDPKIQKMHTLCPWLLTWDDHEVDNNYAGETPEDAQPHDAFMERRANAYQAYYENMPLRLTAAPQGSKMQLYRSVSWGNLAQFTILDTRQYRTDQPCGDGVKPVCPGTLDPVATITGDKQEAWLKQSLDKSPARWNIIANQVLMARIDRKPGPEEALSMDQWSGYEANRDRVLRFLAERKPSNPIVITGDIHSSWVSDLKVNWKNEKDPVVASEFTGTSISSAGDGIDEHADTPAWYRENPHLKMYNGRRGYVMVSLDKAQCRADYRTLPYVTRPGAPVGTHSSWIVENGQRGVKKA